MARKQKLFREASRSSTTKALFSDVSAGAVDAILYLAACMPFTRIQINWKVLLLYLKVCSKKIDFKQGWTAQLLLRYAGLDKESCHTTFVP